MSAADMLGREVAVLYEGLLPQGESRHDWDTTYLARGSYMLVLEMAGRKVVRHVVLQ